MTRGGARPGTGPKVDPLGYMVPFTLRIPASMGDQLVTVFRLLASETGMTAREIHRKWAQIIIKQTREDFYTAMQHTDLAEVCRKHEAS